MSTPIKGTVPSDFSEPGRYDWRFPDPPRIDYACRQVSWFMVVSSNGHQGENGGEKKQIVNNIPQKPRRYLFYVEHNYCYGVLRPIQKILRARGDEVAWLPVGPDFNSEYLHPDERRFDHVREAIEWQPYAILAPGNEVPSFLPGLKIEVFHGLNSGKRRRKDGVQYHFIVRGLFDMYCTHGPNTTQRFQELADQHGHFRVRETGWSKLDPLFDGSLKPTPHEKPTILFASTFSKRLTAAPHVLETVKRLAVDGHWRWLVNMHPKMPQDIINSYRNASGPNLKLVETDDVLPLLVEADAMLCDTSSILSEYLVQHKPAVTFRTARPGDHVIDVKRPEDVEAALERALERPPELMKNIRRYADETHPWRDGQSSQRMLDAIDWLSQEGIAGLGRRPRNLWRHRQMRRLLDYFPS